MEETNGTFRFELPPGIYTITTHIGFAYDLRRAAFRLRSGETATLNLVPRLRLLGTATVVTAKGSEDITSINPPAKFEELDIDPKSELKALVEFEKRDSSRTIAIYRDAVLSFDTVTIYADSIVYEKGSQWVEASGEKVVVDTGGTRRIAGRVKARLSEDLRTFEYSVH